MLNRFFPKRQTKKQEEYIKDYPVFDFSGGMNLSEPAVKLQDKFLSDSLNMFFKDGKLCIRPGYPQFGSGLPLPNAVTGFQQFFKYDGTDYFVCFTTKGIYKYNTGTGCWDLISPSVAVDECESAFTASANVTAARNTAKKRYGTYCAELTIDPIFTTGLAAYHNFSSLDISAYTYLHFYIECSRATTAGQIQILLDNTNGCVSALETLDVPALAANTMTEVMVALATPGSLTALLSIGVNIASALGGATSVYLDQVYAVKASTCSYDERTSCESIYDSVSADMLFIATNGNDTPKKWTGSGNWADLGGSPSISKFVKNFYHHLCLFNCVISGSEAPQREDWTAVGEPENWSTGGAGNVVLAATADGISGSEFISGHLVIIKESSITHQSYVGGVDPFDIEEKKVVGKGTKASGSIQSTGKTILYLGEDNVYEYDGFDNVGVADPVIKNLIDKMNPNKYSAVHSVMLDEYDLYLLFIPSSKSDYCDQVWIYNYVKKIWHYWQFANEITASGYYQEIDKITIGSLLDKIGNLNWRIGSRELVGNFPTVIMGDKNGYIYKLAEASRDDNGTAISWYFSTKAFITNIVNWTRFVSFVSYAKGTAFKVSVSSDNGANFAEKDEVTLSKTEFIEKFSNVIDTTARELVFKIHNDALNSWIEIEGYNIKYIAKEKLVQYLSLWGLLFYNYEGLKDVIETATKTGSILFYKSDGTASSISAASGKFPFYLGELVKYLDFIRC